MQGRPDFTDYFIVMSKVVSDLFGIAFSQLLSLNGIFISMLTNPKIFPFFPVFLFLPVGRDQWC